MRIAIKHTRLEHEISKEATDCVPSAADNVATTHNKTKMGQKINDVR